MLYVFVYVWDYINKVIKIQMSINAAGMEYTEKSVCAEFLYTNLILSPFSECVSPLSLPSLHLFFLLSG